MPERKKILVIPSWYPVHEHDPKGIFFRDQANLMTSDHDLLVLYGVKKTLSLKRFFFNICTFRKYYPRFQGIPELPANRAFHYPFLKQKQFRKNKNFSMMLNGYLFHFEKLIKQGWKPDMIHAQATYPAGIIAAEIHKKYAIPYMITEHQVFLLHGYSGKIIRKIKDALEHAKKVASISKDKTRFILMHNILCDPVLVGNLVDEEFFRIIPNAGKEPIFTVLIVASSSYLKDLYTFYRAMKIVLDQGLRIRIIVAGQGTWGDLKEEYRKFAEDLGILEHIVYQDIVKREDMPALYNSADVFVLTSIAEGLPVSVLEALACGIPVVSTRCGGVEDIIDDENGVLVPIRDHEGIARHVVGIYEGALVFSRNRIREKIVKQMGREAFGKRIKDLYSEIIGKD
jgi:glycosyltransferase involved in cell wall biosynthesis